MEAEANVVGGPVSVGVSEDGFEQSNGVGDRGGAGILWMCGWVELIEDAVAEGVEPGFHAVQEWSGAGDEIDGLDREAGFFEEAAVERG